MLGYILLSYFPAFFVPDDKYQSTIVALRKDKPRLIISRGQKSVMINPSWKPITEKWWWIIYPVTGNN